MNRLELPTLPVTVPTHSIDWELPSENITPLRVVGLRDHRDASEVAVTLSPIHYESGYSYPLIVWLHGVDQTARCLGDVMQYISVRNYVAAAPHGLDSSNGRNHAAAWDQAPDAIGVAQQKVFDAIALTKQRYRVHSKRVFLVGFDVGGTMAMRIALNNPQQFAGAATIGGPLPERHCPLRSLNSIRELPLLIASARHSDRYPERQVCANLGLLHSAGATVSLRQYPGSDDLTTQMLEDLDRWMMELIGQTSAVVVH